LTPTADGWNITQHLQAFVAFDDDAASDVAVFHGANGAFCAGWDLVKGQQQLEEEGSLDYMDFDVQQLQQQQQQQPRSPGPMGPSRLLLSKPVIAAIRSAAAAVAACDVARICGEGHEYNDCTQWRCCGRRYGARAVVTLITSLPAAA
jgi:enoyl-CoA hydratase/carnithine racemase